MESLISGAAGDAESLCYSVMSLRGSVVNVLLVEANPGDQQVVRAMFDTGDGARFQIECVDRLSDAVLRARQVGLDDSQGTAIALKNADLHTAAVRRNEHLKHSCARRTR
jgi:hypothetical protein